MSKIKILNEHLTNMIAAGEVVERPAGIIKELVENSIDALATTISVEIKDGGTSFIKVVDNGSGMSKEDCKLAFSRHATSKISLIEDLWQINSLGFRGEALPSIASVSKITLVSNNKLESTLLEIAFGELKKLEATSSNPGTSITVRELFYKTPARLKHLSSLPYETALISSIISKFALAFPNLSFKLIIDNKLAFETNGDGNLIGIIATIYGLKIAQSAINFEFSDYDYHVSGALILPRINKANRNDILIYINKRMVRSYRISQAIVAGYKNYLPSNRYPIIIINIEMDQRLVDVNVHPSKWEIRLAKEKQLLDLISDKIESYIKEAMKVPEIQINKTYDNFQQAELSYSYQTDEVFKDDLLVAETTLKEEDSIKDTNIFLGLKIIGQLAGKYILAEGDLGLYIIDQHAAEERYNYERLLNNFLDKPISSTDLLIPQLIELSSFEQAMVPFIIKRLNELGIKVEVLNNDLVVRAVPLWLVDLEVLTVLFEIIEVISNDENISLIDLRKKALASAACHSSIRFNRHLNYQEMQQVLVNLSNSEQPYHCPHGRPTLIVLDEATLLKEFYR